MATVGLCVCGSAVGETVLTVLIQLCRHQLEKQKTTVFAAPVSRRCKFVIELVDALVYLYEVVSTKFIVRRRVSFVFIPNLLQTLHHLPSLAQYIYRPTWFGTRHLPLDVWPGRLDQFAFYYRRSPRAPNKRYSAVSTAQHLPFLPQLLLTYGPPDLITSFNHQTAKILQQHRTLLTYYNSPYSIACYRLHAAHLPLHHNAFTNLFSRRPPS